MKGSDPVVSLNRAFTIMEVIMVVVCLGVVAAFMMPAFTKTMAKTTERQVAGNLNVIRPAMEQYKRIHGSYPTDAMYSLSDINNMLGVGLVGNSDISYTCDFNSDPTYYECRGTSPDGWFLHVMSAGPWEPTATTAHCDSGYRGHPCPSCNIGGWLCPWG